LNVSGPQSSGNVVGRTQNRLGQSKLDFFAKSSPGENWGWKFYIESGSDILDPTEIHTGTRPASPESENVGILG
jgi:hypothetical protein